MSIFWAMLKKDLRVLLDQRQVIYVMIITPAILSIALPLLFIFMILGPGVAADSGAIFSQVPADLAHLPSDLQQLMMVINNMLPSYFLMIPIMCGSVLAASGFVTEREHKTMEALFYTPLSMNQLLTAKLCAALIPALIVSWISALLTGLSINIPCWLMRGIMPFPTPIWWLMIFWLLPIFASVGLTFSVLVSAGARSFQEAQQKSGMLVVPIVILMLSQILGGFTFNLVSYFLLGLILLFAECLLLWLVARGFKVEKMI